MIKRYLNKLIDEFWKLETKVFFWQNVELVVIRAREMLGRIPAGTHEKIKNILEAQPIDIEWILAREKEINHDLNAFLEERLRHLAAELQQYFHQGMTSYDTEEAPFCIALQRSCQEAVGHTGELLEALKTKAIAYRYTPMNARTHGQEAEMQSFGKRCLCWYKDVEIVYRRLISLSETDGCDLDRSKLSGAIGTNSGIDPELERKALEILGFRPWPGATQIMPRVLYTPVADALADLATVIDKVATDIRLGARSGRPLWHEPFKKKQKGSSAMPHKKNTIIGENIEGMARMARKYAGGIKENIKTWEERDIAQSSVERVFWPDLFHVTLRAIDSLTGMIEGLVVYPDQMLAEIVASRGTYASNAAKEFLVKIGLAHGLDRESCYRIVQLACFNAFEPGAAERTLRIAPPPSLDAADRALRMMSEGSSVYPISIQEIISRGKLAVNHELDVDSEIISAWNVILQSIFGSQDAEEVRELWNAMFSPSHILANEAHLFKEVFGA